ncbi:XshC-Cox1 family protein [Marinobacter vulgaris]|uniref:XshC-Cox1 family protein n=1 Tax=Marinobacter vulgaris TaxID=1928331 RepID=A0A2V3ZLV6_9GAMM|nr:XdhC family protein [Marinobacter vulgaris]PXX91792.1 XshC-Cox1 family protein [Marinobacter vulgaris]TSJ70700.1 XdhC family protein [Marinobacter vulgaris]
MQSLDYRVVEQAIEWLSNDRAVWLCTVLSTFGSSPREPGSLMVANSDAEHLGSLSGGCIEEDFLARLADGEYELPAVIVHYGAASNGPENARVRLPCGGTLEVLVERMSATPGNLAHLEQVREALSGEKELARHVRLTDGQCWLDEAGALGPRVLWEEAEELVRVRVGPIARLILAGYSTVAEACASFAVSLGYQVVLCDPREEVTRGLKLPEGVDFVPQLPSLYIASAGACTPSTAVVAVTHDPRIDDLAMMAAVKTSASYIGVMGSVRTSQTRAERLRRTGGLSEVDIDRIHMPIGLNLGSKTPSEIALAIMADIVRVRRGRTLDEL